MADISKCNGVACLRKESCYRFTAPKSLVWQSMQNYTPDPDGDCEGYLDNTGR